jgi:hypothetical protein
MAGLRQLRQLRHFVAVAREKRFPRRWASNFYDIIVDCCPEIRI